jgi:hypothetical protein
MPYDVRWTPKSRPFFCCNKLISDEVGFVVFGSPVSLIMNHLRCSPFFAQKFNLLEVDRCLEKVLR